jgi:hypothetical protein
MESRMSALSRLALTTLAVVSLAACRTPPPPAAPAKASPAGLGVMVADPGVRVIAGTTCGEEATRGTADRFKSAATSALARAGFTIATAEADAAFVAALDLEIDYCSDAGIVSGTTALELKRKGGAAVWRGQAVGDQARGETAASTMSELVEGMLYDPKVIKATDDARK